MERGKEREGKREKKKERERGEEERGRERKRERERKKKRERAHHYHICGSDIFLTHFHSTCETRSVHLMYRTVHARKHMPSGSVSPV